MLFRSGAFGAPFQVRGVAAISVVGLIGDPVPDDPRRQRGVVIRGRLAVPQVAQCPARINEWGAGAGSPPALFNRRVGFFVNAILGQYQMARLERWP